MRYGEEDNGAAGSIPEFGAIFMSSIETKKECFKHKVFALPSYMAEFVKHVKAGMVLFLFEYKKRQLFGVYQATSDGAMDIVPHAFNYSGMHFPAQVCFTPIWYCDPLSENEFRDAIRENYFSAKKFNFGLSKDQVRRLLSLFSSRKFNNKMPPRLLAEGVVRAVDKDKGPVYDDSFGLSERGYMETIEYDEVNPAVFSCYHVDSLARAKEDEVFIDDGVDADRKDYALPQGDFLSKRRRMDKNDRLIRNDMAENGTYRHGNLRALHIDSPMDSLDEVNKLADARRLLRIERVRDGNQMDEILNPDLSSDYLMVPLDVRSADDDRFRQRHRLFDKYNLENGSGQDYGMPLSRSKHATDDDKFLYDDFVQGEHSVHDIVKPMVYGDGNLNSFRQAREVIDDKMFFMKSKFENRNHLDCDGSPIRASEHPSSLLHNLRQSAAGGRFLINDGFESKSNFGTSAMEDFSSENFSRPLHLGHRVVRDRKYPIVEGSMTENMDDNILCSTYSTRNIGYTESIDGRIVDDGRSRKSMRLDNEEDISPFSSTGYPSSSKRNQNLSLFPDKFVQEKGHAQLTVTHNFDPSRSKFDDATITRAVPYAHEHPNFSYGYSASVEAGGNSNSVRENHPRHGSLGSYPSSFKRKSSPYLSELENISRSQDFTSEFENKCLPTNTSGRQSSLLQKIASSILNSNFSMHKDMDTSAPVNYRGSLFPKISLAQPCTGSENIESERGLLFAYPFKSSENHCAFDRNLPTASQLASKHAPPQDSGMFAGKDFICCESKNDSVGIHHPERNLASYENQYMNLKENHEISEAPYFDFNVKRRSVFTRLTSRQECQVGEVRNDSGFDYMDATADEVMEMLQHRNNPSPRKPRKLKVVGQPKQVESAIDGKQIQSHTEINHSIVEKKKTNDANLAIPECTDEVPKETRITDFKRRSGTKKNLVSYGIDLSAGNTVIGAKVESSMKTTLRRKKLVRPVFRKTEAAPDAMCSNQTSRLPGQILDKDDKGSCERAISICEAEKPNDKTSSGNVLASIAHQKLVRPVFRKTEAAPDAMCSNQNSRLPDQILDKDDKGSCERAISICEAEMPNDKTSSDNVLASIAHQKLVRPVFGKTEAAPDAICSNQNSRLPGQILDNDDKESCERAIGICEAEMPNNNTSSDNVLASIAHQKLVRPVFGETEAAPDAICSNQKFPGQILDKDDKESCERAISICEGEMPNDKTSSDNVLSSIANKSMDCVRKEHSNSEEQKDLPSTIHELREHETSNMGLQIGSPQVLLKETTQDKSFLIEYSTEDNLSHDSPQVLLKETAQDKSFGIETSDEGNLSKDSPQVLLKKTTLDKSFGVETSDESILSKNSPQVLLKETTQDKSFGIETPDEGNFSNDSPQLLLKERTQDKSFGIETSDDGILSKDIDSTVSSLNPEESHSEGSELGAGCGIRA